MPGAGNRGRVVAAAAAAVAIPATLWAFARLKKHLSTRVPFEGIPTPSERHWLLGHLAIVEHLMHSNEASALIAKETNAFGQVGLWTAHRRVLVVSQLADARTVLGKEYYRDTPRVLRNHMVKFLGTKNISYLEGKEWRAHRLIINKAISPAAALKAAEPSMRRVANTLVDSILRRIREGGSSSTTLVVEKLMKFVTLDVFIRTAFSVDSDCCGNLEATPVATALNEMLEDFSVRLGNLLDWKNAFYSLPTERNRRHAKNHGVLRGFLSDQITSRLAEPKDPSCATAPRRDLFANLLAAHCDEETSKEGGAAASAAVLTSEVLNDVFMGLLHAGYEGTSLTLSFALYLLSQHPAVQDECLAEIRRVQKEAAAAGTDPDPLALVYCKAVLTETLRMYPTGDVNNRVLQKPLELQGGYVAPAGTRIFILVGHIQRDPANFDRPNDFLPERWVARKQPGGSVWEERPDANRAAFLAFAPGGRSCIGQRFAFHEAALVMGILLDRLAFEALDGYVFETRRTVIVQRPKDGIPMRISERTG